MYRNYNKFELYYVAFLPDGTNTGNYFNYTVTNNALSRITIRQIKNKSFNNIRCSKILYDSKIIPPNNANISGISNEYSQQTFTINVGKSSIQCSAVIKDTNNFIFTEPSIKFDIIYGTGIFKDVKKVVIDNDNEGKLVNTWNPKGIKYARRITFYK